MGRERVHILGICGTFMGGIALLAKEVGFEVTGSDENIYPPMSEHLSSQNIDVIDGYEINNIPKADIYLIGNVLSRGNIAVEHILKSGPSPAFSAGFGDLRGAPVAAEKLHALLYPLPNVRISITITR